MGVAERLSADCAARIDAEDGETVADVSSSLDGVRRLAYSGPPYLSTDWLR